MVEIKYSEYSSSAKIKDAKMDLLPDTILSLSISDSGDKAIIRMADAITDNTEIHGVLNHDQLNTLIRVLVQVRNMLEEGK